MVKKGQRKSRVAKPKTHRPKTGKKGAGKKGDGLPVYSDGQLKFRVEGGKSDGKSVTIDLITAKVAADDLEMKHRLDDRKGRPTGPFLVDLAKDFGEMGNFVCTPSVAYQIWIVVDDKMAELQKKTN